MGLADLPLPDLLIRTGSDQRISNFLLWQLAGELFFPRFYGLILMRTPLLPPYRTMPAASGVLDALVRKWPD